MNQLKRDVEAIACLFENAKDIPWGYFSAGIYPKYPKLGCEWLKLGSIREPLASEKSVLRCGLVYRDRDRCYEEFWGDAVEDCLEGISGVIVLQQAVFEESLGADERASREFAESRKDAASRARYFLSRLPEEVFEAGLPIVFDESGGVLDELSPASEHVVFERISFLRPSEFPDDAYILLYKGPGKLAGTYEESVYPVLGVSEKDIAKALFERECFELLQGLSFHAIHGSCRLSGVTLYPYKLPWRPEDVPFDAVVDMLRLAVPGCLDEAFVEKRLSCKSCNTRAPELAHYFKYGRLAAVKQEDVPEYGSGCYGVLSSGENSTSPL